MVTRHGLAPIAAAIGADLRSYDAPLPPVRPNCSKCGARLAGDERSSGVCLMCASPGVFTDPAGCIPSRFRWARLDAPLVPPGASNPIATDDARAVAFEWLDSTVQVLMVVGKELEDRTAPTGVGKTSFAAAVARAAVSAGWRIIWVRAAELGPMYPDRHRPIIDSIANAGRAVVVVDGIGKELAGAKIDSGIITQRIPAMQELIALTYELPKTRFVMTSDITGRMLKEAYGGDAVRRIAMKPNATLIELRGAQ